MRSLVALVGLALVLTRAPASAECPRRERSVHRDAVDLANEADKLRSTNLDAAIEKYVAAVKIDPDDHRLWWKLALAYEKKEDWSKVASACAGAEAAAEKTHGRKTHADYYLRHGIALERLAAAGAGAWFDALAPLQTAIALDPSYAEAYGELGWVCVNMDKDAGATQAWTLAIAKAPDTMRYYVALADLYRRWMFFDHAEKVLLVAPSFAKEGDKDLYGVHAALGGIYLMKRNAARAVAEYEAAMKACAANACADHVDARFHLGVAYAELGPSRASQAIQMLQGFNKAVCKGALAQRWADACDEAREVSNRLGTPLQ